MSHIAHSWLSDHKRTIRTVFYAKGNPAEGNYHLTNQMPEFSDPGSLARAFPETHASPLFDPRWQRSKQSRRFPGQRPFAGWYRQRSGYCTWQALLPVRISSFALPMPTRRASRAVAPAPGIVPTLISVCPIRALLAAIRRSQANANSQPPPRANPAMAATMGFAKRSIRKVTSNREGDR